MCVWCVFTSSRLPVPLSVTQCPAQRVEYVNRNALITLCHMGSDVGQIFPTASLHRDHSISYALVCEKRFSIFGVGGGGNYLYMT